MGSGSAAMRQAGQDSGQNSGKNGCAMSFGPGLSAETMMFRTAA